jgi:uncharacterized protein (TIGR00255 family)
MTGFASISREDAGQKVAVSLKSVNHRFLDVALKAPQALASLESRLRALIQQRLTRGRVELMLSADTTQPAAREVVLDEVLIDRISLALEQARAKGMISGGLTASDVLRIPQALEIRVAADAATGVESAAPLIEAVVDDALTALISMRDTEGGYLRADLEARLATLAGLVDQIEEQTRAGQAKLDARLRERLAALPADVAADPALLAQEVVRFVARSDIDEELTRLRGHFSHWKVLADGPEPCGRKLDFLVQEMNREINTIGAKAEGPRVTEIVVGIKSELERIREQVQNVE